MTLATTRGEALVTKAIGAVMTAPLRISGIGGALPNRFVLRLPHAIYDSSSPGHIADLCRRELTKLQDQGRVAEEFLVTVERGRHARLGHPIFQATCLGQGELTSAAREDASRATAGICAIAHFPVGHISLRTAWGETFESSRSFFIGHDERNDLVVPLRGVSRSHAEVTCATDGTWEILDRNSTNGTFVNGARITKAVIKEGDRISFAAVGSLIVASIGVAGQAARHRDDTQVTIRRTRGVDHAE